MVNLKRRKTRLAGTWPILLPKNSTTSSLTCEQVNRKFCLLFSSFLFLLPFSYQSKKYPLENSALSQTTILHLIRHPPEYTWRQTICWSFSFSCASHHHFSINMVFSAQDAGILRWKISSSDSDVHGRSILHRTRNTATYRSHRGIPCIQLFKKKSRTAFKHIGLEKRSLYSRPMTESHCWIN